MTGLKYYLNGTGDTSNVYCQYYAFDGRLQMSVSLKVDTVRFTDGKLPKDHAAHLRRLQTIVDNYEADMRQSGRQTSRDEVRALILDGLGKLPRQPRQQKTFSELFGKFIAAVEDGTILKAGRRYSTGYVSTANSVLNILDRTRLGAIPIDQITEQDLTNFISDFTALKQNTQYKRGYSKNTVAAYFEFIKTFLKEGTRLAWHKAGVFSGEQIGRDYIEHAVYLDTEELQKISALKLNKLETGWRDAFVLGCMLGLRYSDLIRLSPANRSGDLINIQTQKTSVKVWVPMSTQARQIWDTYKGKLRLPNLDTMNDFVKALGEMAGLDMPVNFSRTEGGVTVERWMKKWEMLGTHTMRRSFATNAFKAGVPMLSIMKVTGHKTSSSFLRYIRVSSEENAAMLMEHPHFK